MALQIIAILAFYGFGEIITHFAHLPLPGSIIGLVLILLALHFRLLKPASLRDGANGLLSRMLLFFVPAVPVLINHREFATKLGVRLMLVVVIGTVLVMGVTGAVVQIAARLDGVDD
jgi:holin-like protein